MQVNIAFTAALKPHCMISILQLHNELCPFPCVYLCNTFPYI